MGDVARITDIHNRSATDIAFFLRAAITAGPNGGEVLPIRYSRNDISLFPGESTTITARYRSADLHGATPSLSLGGYNMPRTSFRVA